MYPDQGTHHNGDVQYLQFQARDCGPWYLNNEECIQQKYPVDTGVRRVEEGGISSQMPL